jgi:hypothetical protein
MAVQILHKRSAVEFKNATGAQLELGELALNYNESGPYLQCKDAAGEIVQLGGVFISAVAGDAPGNPILGKWWLRGDTLFLYNGTTWVEIGGGSGGGGGTPGTITVIGGDGIEATTIGTTITVTADISTSRGLEFSGDQIAVKLGAGLTFDADGKIESTISGGLSYKGTVDVTTATVISGAAEGDLYANTGTGKFSSQWAATTSNATTATDANPGDWVIYQGPQWDHIPTTVTGTDLGIANRDDTDLDVTSSTGADVTIPAATTTLAGLMTAADKTALDSALQDGDADVNPLAGRALTYDAATDPDTLNADIATASALGVVKVGDGIDVDAAGEISVSFPPSETYIGETPPVSPAEGDLWWNSSNDSGRLYVYYEDANSNQWVEASPQGDTLTESDADVLYLSKVRSDTAAGAITFEELTTHEEGVKVTGAIPSDANGLSSGGSNINLSLANKVKFVLNEGVSAKVNIIENLNTGAKIGFRVEWNDSSDTATAPISLVSSVAAANPTTTQDVYNYSSAGNSAVSTSGNLIGYFSRHFINSNSGSGGEYNFYADGDAPSFLAGSTYIGGSTSRNTFELWKSTLTEEQLETLEAGTLVAPANVSLPGDGSFARQWYYDQQDAETQALLDSGELDYPTHLAAATFTDTFALGDKTTLDLLSDGTAQVRGLGFTKGATNIEKVKYRGFYYSTTFECPLLVASPESTSSTDVTGLRLAPYTYEPTTKTNLNLARMRGLEITNPAVNAGGGSAGSVADYRAINILNTGASQLATNGTAYGLFIQQNGNLGGGKTAYGLYVDGTAPSVFRGRTSHAGGAGVSGEGLIVQAMTTGIQIKSILNMDKTTEHIGFFANADTNVNNTKDNIGFKASSALSFTTTSDAKGFYSNLTNNGTAANTFNFYAEGEAPNYFEGDITCNGLINGAFSLRMQSDEPTAFQTTYSTDEEGNQVENQEYIGTTEDLLTIIKDLRDRVAALEGA